MSNPVATYDFTLPADSYSHDDVIELLKDLCKKWCFQKEQGESGYLHYQGRMSLKVKARISTLKPKVFPEMHLSPTCNQNMGNDFYVTKEETRVDGPWSDVSVPAYIPRDVREIKELKPWQAQIAATVDCDVRRDIYVLYEPRGNVGKTLLCRYLALVKKCASLPPLNDYKDLMRIVMCKPTANCYLVDMPRAKDKLKMREFWSGIETLKSGYAYDDRYEFREKYIDPPVIWLFTNTLPEEEMLSKDRWKIFEIDPATNGLRVYQKPPGDDFSVLEGGGNSGASL